METWHKQRGFENEGLGINPQASVPVWMVVVEGLLDIGRETALGIHQDFPHF